METLSASIGNDGAVGASGARCRGRGTPATPLDPILPLVALQQQVVSDLRQLLEGLMRGDRTLGIPTATARPGFVAPAPAPPPRGAVRLGPGTRVLVIGDVHTVGVFGRELDRLLRQAGARVATYGASGASAWTWLEGGPAATGWIARHADGSVERPPWNKPGAVPPLEQLLGTELPDLLVVHLGAHLRDSSEEELQEQVAALCEASRGVKLVWVGPPPTREEAKARGGLREFDARVRAAVGRSGGYVSSGELVSEYSGTDGLRYGGAKGVQVAREWAHQVLQTLRQA